MDQAGFSDFRQLIRKYGYILLILITGVILMLFPYNQNTEKVIQTLPADEKTVTLQEQLSQILSQVEGAGKVRVLLTIAKGERTLYQNDQSSSGTDTVILTDASRNQFGLIQQVDPPTYLGAVVICQGADHAAVKLALTQAVSNATGLKYDRITILKMK